MNQTVLTNRIKLLSHVLVWATFVIIAVLLFAPNQFTTEGSTKSAINAVPLSIRSVISESPIALSHIALVAHDESEFTLDRLRNRWSFLFFGYTHCPDVCPATMQQLVRVKQEMQTRNIHHKNLQFIFISVDPKRDSINHLASYIKYFDTSFIAVTGDIKHIENLEKQIGVYHRYGKPDSSGAYRVDHTSNIFLIDPKARISAKFQIPMDINQVTQQYAGIQELFNRNVL